MTRPSRLVRLVMAATCACLHGLALQAQTPLPTPGATGGSVSAVAAIPTTVALPRFDVGGDLGWYHRDGGDFGDYWSKHNSLWAGFEVGYYWTEHIKTEAGFAATGESRVYSGNTQVRIGTQQYWESGEDYVRSRRFTLTQLYQFGHNAWVHPFVGAGVQVIREQRRGTRYRYPVTSGSSGSVYVQPEMVTIGPTSDILVGGVALAGLKAYMSRRVYFRTDFQTGFRGGADETVLRFGVGVDF